MFTGIIEEVGTVRGLRKDHTGGKLIAGAARITAGLRAGDSVAVNGACLTVTGLGLGTFSCDLSPETLERTTLGRAPEGARINLERSLAMGDRLGGHFVLGHVDGIGKLASRKQDGESWIYAFEYPLDLAPYFVFKGSVAVDGISLTIAALGERCFSVAVIPYTLEHTNLDGLKSGDRVNLETDVLGKYVERFLRLGTIPAAGTGLTEPYLREQGF